MKRLLAYLFIVLGLGLFFNSKSFSISFHDIESLKIGVIQKKTDKFKYVFASSSYKIGKFDKIGYYAGRVKIKKNGDLKGKIFFFPHKGYVNPSSYECSLKTKLKNSDSGDIYLRCVNGWYKGNFINDNLKFQTTSVKLLDTNSGFENSFIENLKLNFISNYKDLKSTRDRFLNTKTQIVKAEPSQTQKLVSDDINITFMDKANIKYYFCTGPRTANIGIGQCIFDTVQTPFYSYLEKRLTMKDRSGGIENRLPQEMFDSELENVLSEFKVYQLNENIIYETIKSNNLLNSLYKNSKIQIAKKEPSQTQKVDEKEIIPDWYISIKKSSENIMYSRGSAKSSSINFSKEKAIESALVELSKQLLS